MGVRCAEQGLIERVTFVIRHIGFKESLASGGKASSGDAATDAILAVVQDADRLDAIGTPAAGCACMPATAVNCDRVWEFA